MFCCYFLSVLYQWITDELFIDKCLDDCENMIEMQPIVNSETIVIRVPIAPPAAATAVLYDNNPKEVMKEESPLPPHPSTPPTTRLRKQIQAEEEYYKEDFEIIDIDMIDAEKKE